MAKKKALYQNAGKTSEIASGDQIATAQLGSGTSNTRKFLRDDGSWQNVPLNCGPTTQATVNDLGNGLINVTSITANFNPQADFSDGIINLTVPASGNIQLVANTYTYIIASYNSGSPVYSTTLDNTVINHSTILNVVQCYWENLNSVNELHVFYTGVYGYGIANKIGHRLIHTERFGYESGLALAEYGTRNVSITSGKLWYDGHEIDTLAASTATSGQEAHFYYHSSGVWQVSKISQYNNTQYDNGTNLVSLGVNRYAVNWVYKCANSTDTCNFIVLGSGNYQLSDAIASQPPAIPDIILKQSILVGRIIVLNGASTATQIDSAFSIKFNASPSFLTEVFTSSNLTGKGTAASPLDTVQPIQTTSDVTFNTANLTNGVKDANVSTPIKIGDSTNTSFVTTNKTVVGSLNETYNKFTNQNLDSKMPTGIPVSERQKFKVAITYSAPNVVATLSFVGANTSFSYYINGTKYTITNIAPFTISQTAAEGAWFLYINSSNVLTLTQTVWSINNPDVLLWSFIFNASNNTVTSISEERHTAGRDIYLHARDHAQGAVYKNGFQFSQYNGKSSANLATNTDNNFGRAMVQISGGSFFDEDIQNTILHTDAAITSTNTSPSTDWNLNVQQFLGFTALATTGTNATTIVFPSSRTLITGQEITVMQGNTTTVRGATTITTGATGTSFTVASVTGMASGDAIVVSGRFPIYYLSNATTWRKLATSSFLGVSGGVAITGATIAGATAQYNDATNGGFVNMTANRYYPVYLIATNNISEPVIAVIGQGQSTNATLATALTESPFQFGNLSNVSGLGIQEIVPFYRLTFHYNTTPGFSNSKIRLVDATFINIRVSTVSGTSSSSPPTTMAASNIVTDTTLFDKVLSSSDTTVQLALNSIDENCFVKAGLVGGQTAYGGTGASDKLTLHGTSNATKGNIDLNPLGGLVSIGTSTNTEGLLKLSSATGTLPLLYLINSQSTGAAPGVKMFAGTNASDYTLDIRDQSGTRYYLYQDGLGNTGFGIQTINLSSSNPNARYLAIAGDGSANSGSQGELALINNRAAANVGDNVGAVEFFSFNNGTSPSYSTRKIAEINSALFGFGGTNGFGGKVSFKVKQDNSTTMIEWMTVLSNGKVGLNVSPVEMFHVYQNVASTDTVIKIESGSSSRNPRLLLTAAGANEVSLQFSRTNSAMEIVDGSLNALFSVATDGRVYGKSLHNNAGSVTGTTNQYIASGTYTPTASNTTNYSSATIFTFCWIRVGNVVNVSGWISLTRTGTSSKTTFTLTTPISSAFTTSGCQGSGVGSEGDAYRILGDGSGGVFVQANANATSANSTNISVTFQYEVK